MLCLAHVIYDKRESMEAGFYRAFEDRYRGSRDDILQRLCAYESFTTPYLQVSATTPLALDIGCGRGEWLQLLQGQGFDVQGIDLDAGMLAACTERGLPVLQGDGIAYMAEQSDNSLTIVSAFHVVEHIPFEAIIQLAKQALRALQPGGLLIFETPNADNLLVASRDFYLDPSHEKPLPADLLAFVLEYVGFERVKIVRLNENSGLHNPEAEIGLWDTVSGVSPDYAVIAQKGGSPALQAALDDAFTKDYGIRLEDLMMRYEQQRRDRWQRLTSHNEFVQKQIAELNHHLQDQQQLIINSDVSQQVIELGQQQQLKKDLDFVQTQLINSQQQNNVLQEQLHLQQQQQHLYQQEQHHLHQQVAQLAQQSHQWLAQAQAHQQLTEILLNSKSWKITAPLRAGMHFSRKLLTSPKTAAKKGLRRAMQFVFSKPVLRDTLNRQLQKHPRLYARLLGFAHHQGLISMPAMVKSSQEDSLVAHSTELQGLSPHARYVHATLTQALQNKNKGSN